jgi:hypothetical protein
VGAVVGRCRYYIHPTDTTNIAMAYSNIRMKTGDYGLAIICYSKAFEIELKYFSREHFQLAVVYGNSKIALAYD